VAEENRHLDLKNWSLATQLGPEKIISAAKITRIYIYEFFGIVMAKILDADLDIRCWGRRLKRKNNC
jgi:hypothetical protein